MADEYDNDAYRKAAKQRAQAQVEEGEGGGIARREKQRLQTKRRRERRDNYHVLATRVAGADAKRVGSIEQHGNDAFVLEEGGSGIRRAPVDRRQEQRREEATELSDVRSGGNDDQSSRYLKSPDRGGGPPEVEETRKTPTSGDGWVLAQPFPSLAVLKGLVKRKADRVVNRSARVGGAGQSEGRQRSRGRHAARTVVKKGGQQLQDLG